MRMQFLTDSTPLSITLLLYIDHKVYFTICTHNNSIYTYVNFKSCSSNLVLYMHFIMQVISGL